MRFQSVILSAAMLAPLCAHAQVGVYLVHTGQDMGGKELAYSMREVIRKSAGLKLANSQKDSLVSVRLVTIVGAGTETSPSSTAYAYVLTNNWASDENEYYAKSQVGICGMTRLDACARTLVADVDDHVTAIQRELRNMGKK